MTGGNGMKDVIGRKQRVKNRKRVTLLLVTICIISLLTGCGIIPEEQEILVPPLAEPEKITYKTVDVKIGDIEDSFTVSGVFVPSLMEDISYVNISGRLKNISVKIGDVVEAGTELAKINVDDIETELEKQSIYLDTAKLNFDYSQTKAKVDLEKLRNEINDLNANYVEMLEMKDLYTPNELEQTKKSLLDKESSYKELQETLDYQLKLKENDLKLTQLNYTNLKEKVDKSILKSPIAGTVTYVATIKDGDYVDAYTTLVRVTSPNSLELRYNGTKANQFTLGAMVEATINNEKYEAKIVSTPTSVPVEQREEYKDIIVFEVNGLTDVSIKSGDKADIKVIQNTAKDAFIVPLSAIKMFDGKKLVYIFDDGLKLERYVELGVESQTEVQIINGIEPDDKIIIE